MARTFEIFYRWIKECFWKKLVHWSVRISWSLLATIQQTFKNLHGERPRVYVAIYLRIHHGRTSELEGKRKLRSGTFRLPCPEFPDVAAKFGAVTFPVGRPHVRFAIRFTKFLGEKSVIVGPVTNTIP